MLDVALSIQCELLELVKAVAHARFRAYAPDWLTALIVLAGVAIMTATMYLVGARG